MLASDTERLASTSGYTSANDALKTPHPVNTQRDITGENKALLRSVLFQQQVVSANFPSLSKHGVEVPLIGYGNAIN